MLIAKGYAVEVKMGGRWERLRGSALHDSAGDKWPSDSILVCAFRPAREKFFDEAADYFGEGYYGAHGKVELPPKALSRWSEIGEVSGIRYSRDYEYEGDYEHPFGESLFSMLFNDEKPVLYSRAQRYHRLELGSVAVWDWKGIVRP